MQRARISPTLIMSRLLWLNYATPSPKRRGKMTSSSTFMQFQYGFKKMCGWWDCCFGFRTYSMTYPAFICFQWWVSAFNMEGKHSSETGNIGEKNNISTYNRLGSKKKKNGDDHLSNENAHCAWLLTQKRWNHDVRVNGMGAMVWYGRE